MVTSAVILEEIKCSGGFFNCKKKKKETKKPTKHILQKQFCEVF